MERGSKAHEERDGIDLPPAKPQRMHFRSYRESRPFVLSDASIMSNALNPQCMAFKTTFLKRLLRRGVEGSFRFDDYFIYETPLPPLFADAAVAAVADSTLCLPLYLRLTA